MFVYFFLLQEDKLIDSFTNHGIYNDFSIEDLEAILESLCDLLSDSVFIPSLYSSFDCDPTKPDIALPLLKSICDCTRFFSFSFFPFSFTKLVSFQFCAAIWC